MDFEAVRDFRQELFQLRGGFGVAPSVVLRDGGLEGAVEVGARFLLLGARRIRGRLLLGVR